MKHNIKLNDIKEFVTDSALNCQIEFLEVGKISTKDEIHQVAKKRGIDLSKNKDLIGFKNIYALTDVANKNKCRLPKEIVEATINTIVSKPINIDHIRKYVIGHYLDAYVKDNKIYAIGVIYKSNFAEEWQEAEDLFRKGRLTTSFEIWCPNDKRKYHIDGTYSLTDMAFAGGAVLFKTKPAFKEAKILEMAMKRSEIKDIELIYANEEIIISDLKEKSVSLNDKDNEIKSKNEGVQKMNFDDLKKLLAEETEEPMLTYFETIEVSDEEFEAAEQIVIAEIEDKVEEVARLTYQDRKSFSDDQFAVVIEVKKKVGEGTQKIRMFPINDEAHVRNALARLGQIKVKQTLSRLGVKIETVKEKILKRAKELNMTDLLERQKVEENEETTINESKFKEVQETLNNAKDEIINLKLDLTKKEEEIASLNKINKTLEDTLITKEEELKKAQDKSKLYKENAIKIVTIREELKDFAKDLSDNDLLNEDKVKVARLTKENTILKASKKGSLEISSEYKNTDIRKQIKEEINKKVKKLNGGKTNG